MQIVFMFLFACVFAVSAHWSSEQRERDFERKRDHELKMWGDKKWDKKSWTKWPRKSIPKASTTTSIYIDDLEWRSNSRESTCSNMMCWYELRDKINPIEWTWVKSTWDVLKKNNDFAPKIFFRYFKAFPASLNWFPSSFSGVSLSTDLPTNDQFLFHAYSCNNWLNMIWYSIDNTEWINTCPEVWLMIPDFNKRWITAIEWKKFILVWMDTIEEELGNDWTPEVETSWEKAMKAFGTCFELSKTY